MTIATPLDYLGQLFFSSAGLARDLPVSVVKNTLHVRFRLAIEILISMMVGAAGGACPESGSYGRSSET